VRRRSQLVVTEIGMDAHSAVDAVLTNLVKGITAASD